MLQLTGHKKITHLLKIFSNTSFKKKSFPNHEKGSLVIYLHTTALSLSKLCDTCVLTHMVKALAVLSYPCNSRSQ